MQFQERKMSLFDVPQEYCFACCISADFTLNTPITHELAQRYNLKAKLNMLAERGKWDGHGYCLFIENIFALVVKEKSWQSATYIAISEAVKQMSALAQENHITHIAMPQLGVEQDNLEWVLTRECVVDSLSSTAIDVLVCKGNMGG